MKRKIEYCIIFLFGGIFLILNFVSAKEKIWINIGPNILASSEIHESERNECWIAASLTDPDFLAGISHAGVTNRTCPVIISRDGGQTWKEVLFPEGNVGFDPLVLAGPDEIMYAMVCASGEHKFPRIWSTKNKGETWAGPTDIYSFSLDHPRMAADTTGGPFHGRLYYAWNEVVDTIEYGKFNIYLHYSENEGKSFHGPIHLHEEEGGKLVMIDIMVLSDGTLIVPYYKYFFPIQGKEVSKKNEHQPLWFLISEDGGNTFSDPYKVIEVGSSAWLDLSEDFPRAFTLPICTSDTNKDSPYRDRIYIVWDDVSRTGYSNIWLIWSEDKGKNWSNPLQVNDNPPPLGKGPKDYRMTPVVAVNKKGIVGVAWYDRRDDPTRRCWNYYMAFSLDGGQTFEKNLKISSKPSCPEKNMAPSIRIGNINPKKEDAKGENDVPSIELAFDKARNIWPGHYTGLVADTEGKFHALWADRRLGTQKLYTTIVEVLEEAPEIPELTEQIDVTKKVNLVAGNANFNENERITEFRIQIQNVSQDPIYSPIELRICSIEKGLNDMDTMKIINSDNKNKSIGAVWDFSSLLGSENRLDPKEITEAKKIRIQTFIESGLDGKFEFRVFGKIKNTK